VCPIVQENKSIWKYDLVYAANDQAFNMLGAAAAVKAGVLFKAATRTTDLPGAIRVASMSDGDARTSAWLGKYADDAEHFSTLSHMALERPVPEFGFQVGGSTHS
jgi:hypothetical protein